MGRRALPAGRSFSPGCFRKASAHRARAWSASRGKKDWDTAILLFRKSCGEAVQELRANSS